MRRALRHLLILILLPWASRVWRGFLALLAAEWGLPVAVERIGRWKRKRMAGCLLLGARGGRGGAGRFVGGGRGDSGHGGNARIGGGHRLGWSLEGLRRHLGLGFVDWSRC